MKLPDIQFRRDVPQLASAKAAKLPNQLRSISAKTQAAGQVISAVDTVLDQNARVEANTRAHKYVRDAMRKTSELRQQYENDRSLPLENLADEMEKIRGDLNTQALKDAGTRTARYLQPAIDNYTTRTRQQELQFAKELARSRTLLNLQDSSNYLFSTVAENPAMVSEVLESYEAMVNGAGLDEVTAADLVSKGRPEIAKLAIDTAVADGQVELAVSMYKSPQFSELPPNARAAMETSIATARGEELSERNKYTASQMAAGTLPLNAGLLQAEDDAVALTLHDPGKSQNLIDREIAEAQKSVAVYAFEDMLLSKEFDRAEELIVSGNASLVLSGDDIINLRKRIVAARTEKKDADYRALVDEAKQYYKVLQAGQAGVDVSFTERLTEVRDSLSPVEDEAEIYNLNQLITQLSAMEYVSGEMEAAYNGNASIQTLTDTTADLLTWANEGGLSYDEQLARNSAVAAYGQLADYTSQRIVTDAAGFIVEKNESAAGALTTFENAAAGLDPNNPASVAQFKSAATAYQTAIHEHMRALSVSPTNTNLLPQTSALTQTIATVMQSADPGLRLGYLTALTQSLPSPVLDSMVDQFAGTPTMRGVFSLLQSEQVQLADTLMRGASYLDLATAEGVSNMEGAVDLQLNRQAVWEKSGIDPFGNNGQNMAVVDAVLSGALGLMEIEGERIDLTRQIPEKYIASSLNLYGGYHTAWGNAKVATYRRADTRAVTRPQEVVDQLDYLAANPELVANTEAGVMFVNDTQVTLRDIKDMAVFHAVGDGEYEIGIRSSVPGVYAVGQEGYVRDENGERYRLNLNTLPMATPQFVEESRRLSELPVERMRDLRNR